MNLDPLRQSLDICTVIIISYGMIFTNILWIFNKTSYESLVPCERNINSIKHLNFCLLPMFSVTVCLKNPSLAETDATDWHVYTNLNK